MIFDSLSLKNSTLASMANVKGLVGVPRYNETTWTERFDTSGTNWFWKEDILWENLATSDEADRLTVSSAEVSSVLDPNGNYAQVYVQRQNSYDLNYIRKSFSGANDASGWWFNPQLGTALGAADPLSSTISKDSGDPGVIHRVHKFSVCVKYYNSKYFGMSIYDRLLPTGAAKLDSHGAWFEFVGGVPEVRRVYKRRNSSSTLSPTGDIPYGGVYAYVEPVDSAGSEGWYRCNLITYHDSESAKDLKQIFLNPTLIPGADTGLNVNGSGTYLWGVQLQNNDLDLPYQPVLEGTYKYNPINYEDFNIDLTPSELLIMFRYYKNISENFASRVASTTSGIFEASGGGRLNYRIPTDVVGIIDVGGENNFSSIDLSGI